MLVIYHGETPLVNCGPRSIVLHLNKIYWNHYFLHFLTSNYHLLHYTINTLFTVSRWDWQPHYYVGAKFLGCVVQVNALLSYWFDNLGFILRKNLLLHSSYLPLGVSQWTCDLHVSRTFSGAAAGDLRALLLSKLPPPCIILFLALLPGTWEHSCLANFHLPTIVLFLAPWHQVAARGVSHFQPFYFVIVLLSLLLLCVVCFLY